MLKMLSLKVLAIVCFSIMDYGNQALCRQAWEGMTEQNAMSFLI